MKETGRWLFLIGVVGGLSAVLLLDAEDPAPGFFPGGPSEIGSEDPDRAVKAIRKWSEPNAWEGTEDAGSSPYFWDFEKVGRPVFLRIIKNDNRTGLLEVWLENEESREFEFFKAYRIAYFSGEPGPKTKEGDGQAPEGFYTISRARLNPESGYHLAMDVGYPNDYDRQLGRTGGLIMIHGKSVSIGCFAMTDAAIEQLYTLVDAALKDGQNFVRVHSFPFPKTGEMMSRHRGSVHEPFWENLKEGWDWFQENRCPPEVTVKDGRYVFGIER